MPSNIQDLEKQLSLVHSKNADLQRQIKKLQAERLKILSQEGVESKAFKELSGEIIETNKKIEDLQTMDLALRQVLDQARRDEELQVPLAEKARKEKLVAEALSHPPLCEECGAVMTPKEPVPIFIVGGWTIISANPRSWRIEFECPKHNRPFDCHTRVVIYPELPIQGEK